MGIRLIIEGNTAYEIDEDCLAARQEIWDSDSEEKAPGKIRRNAAAQKIRSNRSPIFLIDPDRGFMIKFKRELRSRRRISTD